MHTDTQSGRRLFGEFLGVPEPPDGRPLVGGRGSDDDSRSGGARPQTMAFRELRRHVAELFRLLYNEPPGCWVPLSRSMDGDRMAFSHSDARPESPPIAPDAGDPRRIQHDR